MVVKEGQRSREKINYPDILNQMLKYTDNDKIVRQIK